MAWDNEKKKVKTAVAVAYEPGDKAPKILASGRGEVAEKIIAKAKENDVPFYKDNKLAGDTVEIRDRGCDSTGTL